MPAIAHCTQNQITEGFCSSSEWVREGEWIWRKKKFPNTAIFLVILFVRFLWGKQKYGQLYVLILPYKISDDQQSSPQSCSTRQYTIFPLYYGTSLSTRGQNIKHRIDTKYRRRCVIGAHEIKDVWDVDERFSKFLNWEGNINTLNIKLNLFIWDFLEMEYYFYLKGLLYSSK